MLHKVATNRVNNIDYVLKITLQSSGKIWRKDFLTFGKASRPHQLPLPGDERLEEHDGLLVVGPGVHLPVRVPPLLCQLVPGLGLGEELADCPLGEAEHVLGKQALANVVHRQQLTDPGRY